MENIFNISYNTKLERLKIKKESWTSMCYKKIKKHKIITTVVAMFIVLAGVNFYLIYSFMNILQKI